MESYEPGIVTMRAALTSRGSEFHPFLYAPICHEQEGMTLSVLSALARQDVDPWTEAERLSQLPQEKAVKEMLGFLDALPRRTLDCMDRVEVAARLCALLPRRSTSMLADKWRTLPPAPVRSPALGAEKAEGFSLNWRFLSIYICLMLLMNWLIAQYAAAPAALPETDSTPLVAAATPNSVDPVPVSTAPVAESSATMNRPP